MTACNPSAYRITIVNKDVDGHRYFVGTVNEFPHVTVYEDTWADAYTALIGIIEDLYDQALESGEEFPAPWQDVPAYSGRVTVRIPKWLHQRLDEQACEQNVSLNFHISTLLTEGSNWINHGAPQAGNAIREVGKPAIALTKPISAQPPAGAVEQTEDDLAAFVPAKKRVVKKKALQ